MKVDCCKKKGGMNADQFAGVNYQTDVLQALILLFGDFYLLAITSFIF